MTAVFSFPNAAPAAVLFTSFIIGMAGLGTFIPILIAILLKKGLGKDVFGWEAYGYKGIVSVILVPVFILILQGRISFEQPTSALYADNLLLIGLLIGGLVQVIFSSIWFIFKIYIR